MFDYFLLLLCCFWIETSLVFNETLHSASSNEKSSLEIPFQKHQR